MNWPGKLKPGTVNDPLHMVDIMPTLLALSGAKGNPERPFDGRDIWATVAEGKPSPHEDVLINVEAFRGPSARGLEAGEGRTAARQDRAVRSVKGSRRKEQRGRSESRDRPRPRNRLMAYCQRAETQRMDQGPAAFVGEQGKTVFDPDFDITDGGLPREKPVLPKK